MNNKKYIFVTGGVVSGLGKGITAASLGRLLKARGYKVLIQKFDPYLNVDPGTLSPIQHGEVFVTEDGAETDLDLGHYERFIDENLNIHCDITAGDIYGTVLNKEREGEYLGNTVQVIPHITNEIKDRIYSAANTSGSQIIITEIGGTVGDIEALPFFEAIRQISNDVGRENVVYVHVTLVPYLSKSGEMKSKPTQHSVKELLSIGIQPDIIVCRTEKSMNVDMKEKLALFCNVKVGSVIENMDAESLYAVPVELEKQGFAKTVCGKLGLEEKSPDLSEWNAMLEKERNILNTFTIGIIGKYVELFDSYLSLVEGLKHAGIHTNSDIKIRWINAETVTEDNVAEIFEGLSAAVVPGGFGERGVEGKINAISYARKNKIPMLGLGLGMQCAIIEFSRNVLNLEGANSTEFNPETKYPVVHRWNGEKKYYNKTKTIRLGASPCKIQKDTKAYEIYNEDVIYERHRNKYEFNNEYRELIQGKGLLLSGFSVDEVLVEIIEFDKNVHPWFLAVQYHPEFKSRPNKPHPIFMSLLTHLCENK